MQGSSSKCVEALVAAAAAADGLGGGGGGRGVGGRGGGGVDEARRRWLSICRSMYRRTRTRGCSVDFCSFSPLFFLSLFPFYCNRLIVSLVVVCRKVVPRGLNGASELVEKRETMLERVKKEEGERATTRERPENGQATSDTVIQEETRDKIRGERLPAC